MLFIISWVWFWRVVDHHLCQKCSIMTNAHYLPWNMHTGVFFIGSSWHQVSSFLYSSGLVLKQLYKWPPPSQVNLQEVIKASHTKPQETHMTKYEPRVSGQNTIYTRFTCGTFIHWPQGTTAINLNVQSPKTCYRLCSWVLHVELLLGKCHRAPLKASQHWFRESPDTVSNTTLPEPMVIQISVAIWHL